MKAFKTNSYSAPIVKERNELGKYSEKISQKIKSDKDRISKHLKNFNTNFGTVPNKKLNKRNRSFNIGDYFIVTLIGILFILLFFIVSSFLFNKSKSDL